MRRQSIDKFFLSLCLRNGFVFILWSLPSEEVGYVSAFVVAFEGGAELGLGVISQVGFENGFAWPAAPIMDKTTGVMKNVRVTPRSVRDVGVRNGFLARTCLVILGHASVSPAHGALVTVCKSTVVHDHVGVSAAAVAHVVSVPGAERSGHTCLERVMRVLGRRSDSVASIACVLRESHFLINYFYFTN